MATILPVEGKSPRFGKNCFIAPNATIVGDVEIGDECSIWFNAVVRGDVNSIQMGNRVNIQDGVVIHGTYKKAGVRIGNDVSVGHNAIVHGCIIHDKVLIGMGAIVMDNAEVGSNSIIAAGAIVLEGTRIESGTIYGGIPARKIKDIPAELISGQIERIAQHYLLYSGWFSEVNAAPRP
ncbi:MAG TPA: gamma carbonic anhydrase family protein [Puia sp.]|jgi:carbonic anhydrase/acetyltransferase-like protein (isoleucine patch superfamily)|nr:gamma carbonic anhydrase family protein [Puia sp.]